MKLPKSLKEKNDLNPFMNKYNLRTDSSQVLKLLKYFPTVESMIILLNINTKTDNTVLHRQQGYFIRLVLN